MANPSLQIGNSNWAIKEDNLLGYSTAGTRFVPQPITMTRASAGTRVNSSGLVETVELLGSEEVTNGAWTDVDGAATFYDNKIKINSGVNGTLNRISQTILENNKSYRVQYEVLEDTGVTNLSYFNGQTYVSIPKTIGVHTFHYAKLQTSLTLYLRVGDSVSGNYIVIKDNISVKESTKNNLARVDYDGTASSLLVEPERTNLITYSSDFSDTSWTKVNATIAPDSIISPDGTLNADKITDDSTNGVHRIQEGITTASSGDFTYSVFLKKGTLTTAYFQIYNSGTASTANVDLDNGTISGGLGFNHKIEDYGNDWYRCSISFISTNTATTVYLYTKQAAAYIGSGDYLYAWGVSLEEGSYPTSYIPTDGGTVTRVKDQYTKTGISNLIGQTEGVIFMDWIMNHQSNSTSEDVFTLSVTDGTTNNLFVINNYNNALTVYLKAAGTNQFSNSSFSGSDGLRIKLAFAYKVNDFSLVINGSVIATDNSGSVPLLNKININAYETALPNDSILVKDFKLYTTRLTDSELIALTT